MDISDNTNMATKAKIIDYAVKLFKEKGYDNVTVSHICKEVGISKTSFYYHFKSKEDLISEYVLASHYSFINSYQEILLMDTFVKQFWGIFNDIP